MNTVSPALGLTAGQVRDVLAAAGMAPSLHNSQPWRFAVRPDRIELHLAPGHRLPATDPDGRELRLSCGAALFNLRLALQDLGVRPLVTLDHGAHRPGGDAARPLAVVRHGGRSRRTDELARLLRAIPERRTNRAPFVDAPVPPPHRGKLARAVEAERCWLHAVTEAGNRAHLRDMVTRAQREQAADPAFRAELAAWTGRDGDLVDGVPLVAGGPRPEPQDEWVLRDFGAGRGRVRVAGKDFEPDPVLVVLCSFQDDPADQVQAGQALQHLLLTATALGLSASFLSQPIEVPAVRAELRRAVGNRLTPQAVLRIGYGSPVPETPRRPVSDLIVPTCPSAVGGAAATTN